MRKDKREAFEREMANTEEWLAILAEAKEAVPLDDTEREQEDTKKPGKYQPRHKK